MAPTSDSVKEPPVTELRYHGSGPAGHYNLYDRNLPKRNAAIAGAIALFVGGVYVYTMRAVGSNNELDRAVRAYEREQAEKERQQKEVEQQQPLKQ